MVVVGADETFRLEGRNLASKKHDAETRGAERQEEKTGMMEGSVVHQAAGLDTCVAKQTLQGSHSYSHLTPTHLPVLCPDW